MKKEKEIKKGIECVGCGTKYQKIIYICPQCGGTVFVRKQEQKSPIGFFS